MWVDTIQAPLRFLVWRTTKAILAGSKLDQIGIPHDGGEGGSSDDWGQGDFSPHIGLLDGGIELESIEFIANSHHHYKSDYLPESGDTGSLSLSPTAKAELQSLFSALQVSDLNLDYSDLDMCDTCDDFVSLMRRLVEIDNRVVAHRHGSVGSGFVVVGDRGSSGRGARDGSDVFRGRGPRFIKGMLTKANCAQDILSIVESNMAELSAINVSTAFRRLAEQTYFSHGVEDLADADEAFQGLLQRGCKVICLR